MIKIAVKIEKFENMPRWAVNYFKKNIGFYYAMLRCKKSKREPTFQNMIEESVFLLEENNIYFNSRGDAVFYWKTSGDRLFFILRWS